MILGAGLDRNAHLYGEKAATIDDDGRSLTHRQFRDAAWRLADGFSHIGVAKGSRVGVLCSNCSEFLLAYFALGSIGAWMVPLNYGLSAVDLSARLAHAEVDALLASADHIGLVDALVAGAHAGLKGKVFIHGEQVGSWPSLAELIETGRPVRPDVLVSHDDTLYLAYTSGTTGSPKGVMVPHRAIVSGFLYKAVAFGLTERDVSINAGPYWHSAPLDFASLAVYLGGTALIQRRFDACRYMEATRRHGATNTFVVPTMLQMLLDENGGEKLELPTLRCIVSGGAALPTRLKERILDELGPVLYEFYGSTESRSLAYIATEEMRSRHRCVGRSNRDVQIRILDEAGRDVEQGGIGEIFVRGPGIFNGYFKDETRTREAFRNGWFSLGDMGKLDAEGYLYLVDRKNDMLITGGENVYPNDVEEVIRTVCGVIDVAVIGVPDPKWGERVAAFVQLAPGTEVTAPDIAAACRLRLPRYMVPRKIEFVQSLPRNSMGKVLRRVLREPFWEAQDANV